MPDARESGVLDSISLAEPWSLVETFAGMPRCQPEDVHRAGGEIAARLARLGIPHQVFEPELYLSIPLSGSVEAEGRSLPAKPPSMSRPVPDGVAGELVHVAARAGSLRSYSLAAGDLLTGGAAGLGERLRGRILLTEGFGNPALTAIAEGCGALGLIVINPGENIHWGTCTTIWGNPGLEDRATRPGIPVLAVNHPDGQWLCRQAESGRRVTLRSDLREGWFRQPIPVAEIRGREAPEQFLLLHGHYDSWDVGVGDNATGDATMLEVARVLHQHRRLLRRSVRVAWWPGHSTGRYAGSTWYADTLAREIDAGCVASVNCDSPGCRWATSYHRTTCMAEMRGHVTEIIREIAGQTPDWIRPKRAGDHSFYGIGLPTYFSLTSTMPDSLRAEKGYYEVSGCGGNIAWHTEDDTLAIADREVLERDIRIYTLAVLRHAAGEHLPDDWRATVAEFAATLDGYQAAAGDEFDLAPAIAATAELAGSLDRFQAGIAAGRISAAVANSVRLRLARILIPINFSRAADYRHDRAVLCPPLPGLAAAAGLAGLDADGIRFAQAGLVREQNRYLAAMARARDITERVTG